MDLREALKAGGWLKRNLPRMLGWAKYLLGKRATQGLLLVCLWHSLFAGSCIRFIANLPDLPEPPGVATMTPTPSVGPSATPTQGPSPTPEPTKTPAPSASPTPSSTPPSPTPFPTQQSIRMLPQSPWTAPQPPSFSIPAWTQGQPACKPPMSPVGPDRNGRIGCTVAWTCAPGTNGRSPAEVAQVGLTGGHVILDPTDGLIRDVDNGLSCGTDAWGRRVCDGIVMKEWWEGKEEKWWARISACDPLSLETPSPTPKPRTPTVPTSCQPVESQDHWMAPGNHCHAWKWDGSQIRCLVDSTIRPICDEDHQENWQGLCGFRTHDSDYSKPEGAMNWKFVGAIDLGPNEENSAQRWILGWPGDLVKVTVCIPPGMKTPDGCLIRNQGGGCGTREFILPSE